MFRRFFRSESGNLAIATALMVVPLVGGISLAVDFGRAVKTKNSLQGAADAAVLAVVKETKGDFSSNNTQALADFAELYFHGNTRETDTIVDLELHPERMSATVSANIDHKMLFPIFAESWNVPVLAEATLMERTSVCLLALGTTGTDFSVSGSASFEAPGCRVHSNSTSSSSLSQSGSASASAKQFCTAGGASGRFSPVVESKCPPLDDPFIDLAFPSANTACTSRGENIGSGNTTIFPGTYCGSINLHGNANVTMAPGTYIIRDGALIAASKTRLAGDGVVIVLQGSSYFSFEAGSTVSLTAPTSGEFAGVVIAQDGANSISGESRVHAGGSVELTGSVYLPKQTLTVSGGGSLGITASQTAFVVDRFNLTGNGSIALRLNMNSDFKSAGYDPAPLGGGYDARLVR